MSYEDEDESKKDTKPMSGKTRLKVGALTTATAALLSGAINAGISGGNYKASLDKSLDTEASENVRQIEGKSGRIMTNAEVLAEYNSQRDLVQQHRDAKSAEASDSGLKKGLEVGAEFGAAANTAAFALSKAAQVLARREEKPEVAPGRGKV